MIHGTQKENNPNMTPLLQTLVTVIILIIAIVTQITTQIKRMAKKTTQVIENATKRASCNKIIRNIKDFHRTLTSTIELATNTTDHTNRKEQVQINNKTARYSPGTRKLNDEYDESYQSLTSRTHQLLRQLVRPATAQSPHILRQRPNTKTETPEHKTLNNALVTTNEVLNSICKCSVNHAPSHTSHRNSSG